MMLEKLHHKIRKLKLKDRRLHTLMVHRIELMAQNKVGEGGQ